jgi:hypothetical protein
MNILFFSGIEIRKFSSEKELYILLCVLLTLMDLLVVYICLYLCAA